MLEGLTEEQSRRLNDMLLDLMVRAEAEAVLLCDRGGNILAQQQVAEYPHQDNIAALAAGSFFATRELARLVGEPEFRCVLHQGRKKSVYMQGTKTDLLLLVFYGRESNTGIVKLFADKCCVRLDEFIRKASLAPALLASVQTADLKVDDKADLFRRADKP